MGQLVRGVNVSEGWGGINAATLLGVRPAETYALPETPMGAMSAGTGTPLTAMGDKPWHPDSPLFWVGLVIAATFGLVGASTQLRVGPFRAGAAAGRT